MSAYDKSMKITLIFDDGRKFECVEPYVGSKAVTVKGAKCPVCAEKSAITDERGIIRACAGVDSVKRALKEMQAEFGPCTVTGPPDDFRVRMPDPSAVFGGWEGRAVCFRCKSPVGTLTVELATMFGREEDARVLSGIWKVY